MPPHLPRPTLGGVLSSTSCLRASTSTTTIPASVTWSARRQSRTTASPFSTTSAAAHLPVPPESPKYIRVPVPPQSNEERLPPVRGHLPVPRDVFPKGEGRLKMKPGYVEAAAPISASEKAGLPPKSESEARRRVEAATRRDAFATGLKGLWERKEVQTTKAKERTIIRLKRNRKAAMAPERPDDILSRSTFGPPSLLNTAVELDPLRFERAEEARKRHEVIVAKKAEARRDALTQLYVAAGDFIVDEQELEQRVNDIFAKGFVNPAGLLGSSESIWDSGSIPISVGEVKAEMFSGILEGSEATGFAAINKSAEDRTAERQKRVAEELTGGKL
ncbi:hypothetical protein B0T16DRAFT_319413 [Cercophora newfieldiana]|uniref:Uncharacterized protein n=1 Tax=Cercophora newfieldiana TaxID=92897 RepID=A0AA39YQ22_9PEZI|nr:hypothetical protein B0T16DRAFT_319413 [Cercophora newfieldiana]